MEGVLAGSLGHETVPVVLVVDLWLPSIILLLLRLGIEFVLESVEIEVIEMDFRFHIINTKVICGHLL